MTNPPPEIALSLEQVRFLRGDETVLDGIDLSVPVGTICALMGPSGCGKSTLLAIAAGLLAPSSGTVHRLDNRPSIVFQDPRLLPWRSALDNVAFALKADRLPGPERRARARDMLAAVGLQGDDPAKYPRQLSGGMRQRTALARALVTEPSLLLLDEPFGALDPGLAQQMHRLVRDYVEQQGASALIVTHDPREALRIAERVLVLSAAPARGILDRNLTNKTDDPRKAEADIEAALLEAWGIETAHR